MDTVNYKAVGQRIRQLRCQHGMTQEDLSEKAEVSMSFIGLLERGEQKPSLETMVRLADTLDCSLDYLTQGFSKVCKREQCYLYEALLQLAEGRA